MVSCADKALSDHKSKNIFEVNITQKQIFNELKYGNICHIQFLHPFLEVGGSLFISIVLSEDVEKNRCERSLKHFLDTYERCWDGKVKNQRQKTSYLKN